MRVRLDSEDISEALLQAGFELRPEDCDTIKFGEVAKDLTERLLRQVRAKVRELQEQLY